MNAVKTSFSSTMSFFQNYRSARILAVYAGIGALVAHLTFVPVTITVTIALAFAIKEIIVN